MPNILITGAGSGIGRATARAFVAAGWDVAVLGRTEASLRETAPEALILPCDVTHDD
jgi:NAD(P)-dependent dehydrogenase (short-subunit alcohol dehydrogenase family)